MHGYISSFILLLVEFWFLAETCVLRSLTVWLGKKSYFVVPNPLMEKESLRDYNCYSEPLSGSIEQWIFKSM